MSEQDTTTVKKRSVIVGFLLLGLILTPAIYGMTVIYTMTQLYWSLPRLYASQDGWDISVTLEIDVKNPTMVYIPLSDYIAEIKIDGHILHKTTLTSILLQPHKQTTIKLTTVINADLFSDLFWTLVNYLQGDPVTVHMHFKFTVNVLITDLPFLIKQ